MTVSAPEFQTTTVWILFLSWFLACSSFLSLITNRCT